MKNIKDILLFIIIIIGAILIGWQLGYLLEHYIKEW